MSSKNNRLNRRRKDSGASGPELLLEWVHRFRDLFRSCYRNVKPGSVVWAMPRTESPHDPPLGFDVVSRQEAHDRLKRLPPFRNGTGLESPPLAGAFYVVASRAEGRFRGTFVGMLSAPGPGELLPPTVALGEDVFIPPTPPAALQGN
jgi:hypothetical protein